MRFLSNLLRLSLSLVALAVTQASSVAVTPYGYDVKDVLAFQNQHKYRYGLANTAAVVRRSEDETGTVQLEKRDSGSSTRHHRGKEGQVSGSGSGSGSHSKLPSYCKPGEEKKVVVKRDDDHWLYKRSAPVHTTAKCKGVQRAHPLP